MVDLEGEPAFQRNDEMGHSAEMAWTTCPFRARFGSFDRRKRGRFRMTPAAPADRQTLIFPHLRTCGDLRKPQSPQVDPRNALRAGFFRPAAAFCLSTCSGTPYRGRRRCRSAGRVFELGFGRVEIRKRGRTTYDKQRAPIAWLGPIPQAHPATGGQREPQRSKTWRRSSRQSPSESPRARQLRQDEPHASPQTQVRSLLAINRPAVRKPRDGERQMLPARRPNTEGRRLAYAALAQARFFRPDVETQQEAQDTTKAREGT